MSCRVLLGAMALCLIAPLAVKAQETAQSDATAEVIAVVEGLFDAMRARDTLAVRRVFDPAARLVSSGRDGSIQVQTVDQFIRNLGMADPAVQLNERITDPEIRIDGNLASVWAYYTFHRGEQFSHCGYDAFQLYRTRDGWKIVHLADTRRTQGCADEEGAG